MGPVPAVIAAMKLYSYRKAPSPRRVRIYLAEKGLSVPTVEVDLAAGGQFDAAFREVNPRCVVPYLVLDDGTGIGEAAAICEYLEELHPEPALLGTTPAARTVTRMWDRVVEEDGFRAIAEALRNGSEVFRDRAVTGDVPYAQIPALAERGMQRTRRFLDALDARLGASRYVAGSEFSVADITAFVCVDFARWVRLAPEPHHAHLLRWYEAVAARPSTGA